MDNRSQSATLYFKSGSSDKVYHAQIDAAAEGGYVVNVTYGRRGGTLSTGTKTKTPVDYEAARRIFEKVMTEKRSKGYTDGEAGTPYLQSADAGRVSGLLPQLLNVVADADLARVMTDPLWIMQEKFDGRRLLLRKVGGDIDGINKLGLVVSGRPHRRCRCGHSG